MAADVGTGGSLALEDEDELRALHCCLKGTRDVTASE